MAVVVFPLIGGMLSCTVSTEGDGRLPSIVTHLMFPALKEGATALRTAFQWSFVCPVSRLVPPRNCTIATCHLMIAVCSAQQSEGSQSRQNLSAAQLSEYY